MMKIPSSNPFSKFLRALFFAVVFFIGCGKDKPIDKPITPEQSLKATQSMVEWLECEECEENQLENVLQYGQELRPLFIRTMKLGPASASLELYRRELEKRFDELVAYSQTHPHSKPTLPKDKFVALYLGNFAAQYRVRAAQALAKIGGNGVKLELQRAKKTVDRADVKAAIEAAYSSMP